MGRREQLAASLRDKAYRAAFVQEEIAAGIPFQVRAMRQARGWTQQELGRRAGMSQSGVGRLENPNDGGFTLATLRRLAAVFDVALAVRFESFERCLDYAANLSPDDLAVPPYAAHAGRGGALGEEGQEG